MTLVLTSTYMHSLEMCVYIPEMRGEVFDREHIKGVPADDGETAEDARENNCDGLHRRQPPDQ